VHDFATQFAAAHGITLVFKEEVTLALQERAQREGCAVDTLCARLFIDFPFGLQLVARSTGQTIFDLTKESVEQPDQFLSNLVVSSYRQPEPTFTSDTYGS
jgi:hypothetical protein